MKIAYLDPPYSRHFHHLAAAMARSTGGSALALLSSPAYRLYTRRDPDRLWPAGSAEPTLRVPEAFERCLLVDPHDPAFLGVFAHAVQWFRQVFREEGIDICLAFSDVRPFSIAARLAAEECGVVCVWFERGAYRFGTSSLSTSGLNARFDLAAARMDSEVEGLSIRQRVRRRDAARWLRTRFAIFMAWNGLAVLREPLRGALQHKRYGWRHYLQLGWRQWRDRLHADAVKAEDLAKDGRPLVLVPLQLETDSQFRASSPFADNHAFIDYLLPEIRSACPQARILLKKHPMDPGHYELPAGAQWVHGSLSRLFSRASAVVCINSNVGYEAATRGKRVLCFGESFYTAGPIVMRVSRESFGERLQAALAAGDDAAAGMALRAMVLRHYQTPGDVWAYTGSDIAASAAIVLQHVASARARMQARQAAARVAAGIGGRPAATARAPDDPVPAAPPTKFAAAQASSDVAAAESRAPDGRLSGRASPTSG